MSLNTDNIRLVFGLKLKQLRIDKAFSLQELSQKSGLSMSYINEIEKGKKYPKADKIVALAEAMGVDYDTLVSLKLNKKLEPISELLNSNFLTELPLEIFGISPADLLELLSDAPTKLSAFIGTIVEIGRNYNMGIEHFFFAVLRSYQEMHDNYFPEIEEEIDKFLSENNIAPNQVIDEFLLTNLLTERYGYTISYFDEKDHPELATLRSILIPKTNKLLINRSITSDQRAFTLGRELGFLVMKLKKRPLTSSWVEVKSFEEVFNNFKASYFSGGILIRREQLIDKLQHFFNQTVWKPQSFIDLLEYFQATPETLFYRMSNVLPKHFGIDQFFFVRMECKQNEELYYITKEMHLSKQHNPYSVVDEHYCRRWVSVGLLQDLVKLQTKNKYVRPIIAAQLSTYKESENEYAVFSMARPLNIIKELNISVSVGFVYNDALKSKVKFLEDAKIQKKTVNQTCERCSIFDCKDRVAAPIILQKKRQIDGMKKALERLMR